MNLNLTAAKALTEAQCGEIKSFFRNCFNPTTERGIAAEAVIQGVSEYVDYSSDGYCEGVLEGTTEVTSFLEVQSFEKREGFAELVIKKVNAVLGNREACRLTLTANC